jgi:hypothetical protein
MRTFYYALGGGLGHLTRSLAVVYTLAIDGPIRITTSLTPELRRMIVDLPAEVDLLIPPQDLNPRDRRQVADWIEHNIGEFSPEQVFVDCFPAGVLGELSSSFAATIPKTLVTRCVTWSDYLLRCAPLSNWPRYEKILTTEPLEPLHIADLEDVGPVPHAIALEDFIADAMRQRLNTLAKDLQLDRNTTLAVHSGPADETEQILRQAIEQTRPDHRIVLISPLTSRPPTLPPRVEHRECYPVWPLFEHVGKIFTAAGANSMRQLSQYHGRHVAVALDRPLDDQARRTPHHKV